MIGAQDVLWGAIGLLLFGSTSSNIACTCMRAKYTCMGIRYFMQ